MNSKIYIGRTIDLAKLKDVTTLIIFGNLSPEVNRKIILIDKEEGYRRKYLNFVDKEKVSYALFSEYFSNFSKIKEEIKEVAQFALRYRDFKLYNQVLTDYKNSKILFKEISTIIEAYYKYYSIACSILTALFFSNLGLPEKLPKVFDHIYGKDFLDDFFFAPAFTFTVFETTVDLLTKDPLDDEISIAKSFISFLLWRYAKNLLKFSYNRLIKIGVKPEKLWITL
ncbi:MAG: hypothetical protein ACP5KO_07960 [Caldimicrobium sp.]|jgi:hypothetical protein